MGTHLGSSEREVCPGIVTTAMRADYRDCMEDALAAYGDLVARSNGDGVAMTASVEGFAYWLFRYSSMIQPSEVWRKEREERQ